MRTVVSRVVAIIAVVLLATACGDDTKVGSDKLLNFNEKAQQRLGQATTTTRDPTATTTPAGGKAGLGAATTVPAVTTTVRRAATFDIAINSDTAGNQFEPSAARVFKGTEVRFTNKDTVSRSVESDTRAFASGPIDPGATWVYTANTVGNFNYHDGTRPYAVGRLEVAAR